MRYDCAAPDGRPSLSRSVDAGDALLLGDAEAELVAVQEQLGVALAGMAVRERVELRPSARRWWRCASSWTSTASRTQSGTLRRRTESRISPGRRRARRPSAPLVGDEAHRARQPTLGVELGEHARALLERGVVTPRSGAAPCMARRTSSSMKCSRSLPRSREGIETTIFVPDQCADPVLVRRELARTSSSGRSKDAGTTVTVVDESAASRCRAPVVYLTMLTSRGGPGDDPRLGDAPASASTTLALPQREGDGGLLGDVGGDLEAVLDLAVHLDHERLGPTVSSDASATGHGDSCTEGRSGWRRCHSSAVTCGVIGASSGAQRVDRLVEDVGVAARLGVVGPDDRVSAARGCAPRRCGSTTGRGRRSPRRIVWCTIRRSARSASVSGPTSRARSAVARRQSRSRNRRHPSITLSVWSVQSNASAGGPTERWKSRSASAPTLVEVLLGRDEVALRLGHLRAVHADHAPG